MAYSNDDMDSTMMWSDLTGKVQRDNSMEATSNNWFTLPRDANPSTAGAFAPLNPKPENVTRYSFPVPFPAAGTAGGKVVWFDNSSMHFLDRGSPITIPFPSSVPANCRPLSPACTSVTGPAGTPLPPSGMSCDYWNSTNKHIFITDGVNSVTMGQRDASRNNIICLVNIAFDWSAPSYTASMLTVTGMASGYNMSSKPVNWHSTEQDANGGDLLWTVDGKPAWVRASERVSRI
jgi:hypothetical protein